MGLGRVTLYWSSGGTIDGGHGAELEPLGLLASRFGTSIHGGKDLNGDEAPDLVVGAPRDSAGSGHVGVYLGGQRLPRLSGTLMPPGMEVRASFGATTSLAGDLDGDGLADLAVASPRDNGLQSTVFIYRGNRSTTLSAPTSRLVNPETSVSVFGDTVGR